MTHRLQPWITGGLISLNISLPSVPLQAAEWTFAPQEPLFADLVTDPRRPRMAVEQAMVVSSELTDRYPQIGDRRFVLSIGEHLRFLRLETAGLGRFDFSASGAFFGQFDQTNQLDVLGWDGWYSLGAAWQMDQRLTWRLQYRHLSSHIGDEMIENTGRTRRGYTREDLVLESMLRSERLGAFYGGYGIKIHLGNAAGLDNVAMHAGWQMVRHDAGLWGAWGWQAGVHGQWFEDNDFETNVAIHIAAVRPSTHGDSLRLSLNAYHGRMQIGELNDFDEQHISLGLGWDF